MGDLKCFFFLMVSLQELKTQQAAGREYVNLITSLHHNTEKEITKEWIS